MKKTNVLLLAMSKLTKDKKSSFTIKDSKDKEIIEDCIGQLEPITKLFIDKHSEEEVKVLMLCTNDTIDKDQTNNFANKTAVNYFKERIKDYCRYRKKLVLEDNAFESITLDVDKPMLAMREAVNKIRKIKNADCLLDFWIDTHGGFREVAVIMESIISLLGVYKIAPNKILGIQFADEENKTNYIVDQKSSFDMFKFVSGMNEFIKYGSVELLQEYFKEHKGEGNELKDALTAMEKVSDGLQECNQNKYNEGLDGLAKEIVKIKKDESVLGLFGDYIDSNYGVLLDSTKRSTIDVIERCRNTEQIQQALTILETWMPKEIVKRKIITFDNSELDKLRNRKEKDRYVLEKDVSRKDKENAVFDSYVTNDEYNEYFNAGPDRPNEKHYANALVKKSKFKISNSFFCASEPVSSMRVTMNRRSNVDTTIEIRTIVDDNEFWAIAGELMRLHRALKETRNKFNHCDPDRMSIDNIRKLLDKYVEDARILFEKYPIEN
ncbi:MAG: TM1812 family CRISPR-associated protein [Lachnospiraceae bacterium]|nr:TM1812 family CRISPR-associated protein [Lachnospiraceae bacterium]